ncbi:MAG TPA: hypothetical protein VFP21_11770, partial [Solirubrobacterales bacterium]|nr:hypothetical protein [Solirubrobacterales bacterium]
MRTKCALVLASAAVLALQITPAGAAPNRPRWEETVDPQAAKIILHNLGNQPAEAALGAAAVAVPAAGATEVRALPSKAGGATLRSDAPLLVVQAPEDFDAKFLEIDPTAPDRLRAIPGNLLLRPAPEWARELALPAGASVRHGDSGWATVASDDAAARVEVAVALLAPHTRVRIRQLDSLGNEVTSLVISASRPVRWRATLGPVDGTSRIELRTLRGEAAGTAGATGAAGGARARRPRILPTKSGGGTGSFNPEINWDGDATMTYTVSGGPASLCGDLHVSRNGAGYTVTSNWMCLDASGNGSAGPYYYSSQTADETAVAYIVWSNGWSTNSDTHIWDVSGPSAAITSSNGPPAPTSFSGTASDPANGAGFSSSWNSRCVTYFQDTTTGLYWDPTYGYSDSYIFYNGPYCTVSGMPSHSVTWSEGRLPPGYAHV